MRIKLHRYLPSIVSAIVVAFALTIGCHGQTTVDNGGAGNAGVAASLDTADKTNKNLKGSLTATGAELSKIAPQTSGIASDVSTDPTLAQKVSPKLAVINTATTEAQKGVASATANADDLSIQLAQSKKDNAAAKVENENLKAENAKLQKKLDDPTTKCLQYGIPLGAALIVIGILVAIYTKPKSGFGIIVTGVASVTVSAALITWLPTMAIIGAILMGLATVGGLIWAGIALHGSKTEKDVLVDGKAKATETATAVVAAVEKFIKPTLDDAQKSKIFGDAGILATQFSSAVRSNVDAIRKTI